MRSDVEKVGDGDDAQVEKAKAKLRVLWRFFSAQATVECESWTRVYSHTEPYDGILVNFVLNRTLAAELNKLCPGNRQQSFL